MLDKDKEYYLCIDSTLEGRFLKIEHHQNQTFFRGKSLMVFPKRFLRKIFQLFRGKPQSAERNLYKVANSKPLKHQRGDFFFSIKIVSKTLIRNMFEF